MIAGIPSLVKIFFFRKNPELILKSYFGYTFEKRCQTPVTDLFFLSFINSHPPRTRREIIMIIETGLLIGLNTRKIGQIDAGARTSAEEKHCQETMPWQPTRANIAIPNRYRPTVSKYGFFIYRDEIVT